MKNASFYLCVIIIRRGRVASVIIKKGRDQNKDPGRSGQGLI